MNAISSTSFDDVTGQRFLFTEEGGSTRGYHLYAVLGTGASGYFDDVSFMTENSTYFINFIDFYYISLYIF